MSNAFEDAVAAQLSRSAAARPAPSRRRRARVEIGDISVTPDEPIIDDSVLSGESGANLATPPHAAPATHDATPVEVADDEPVISAPPHATEYGAQAQEPAHDDDAIIGRGGAVVGRDGYAPILNPEDDRVAPPAAVAAPPAAHVATAVEPAHTEPDADDNVVGGDEPSGKPDGDEDDRVLQMQADRQRLDEARARGRRRDIVGGVLGGLGAVGGALMAGIGAARGNGALASAGSAMMGMGMGAPTNAADRMEGDVLADINRRNAAQREMRAEDNALLAQKHGERTLAIQEGNAENYAAATLENQRQNALRGRLAIEQNARQAANEDRQYGATNDAARLARERLDAAIQRYTGTVRGATAHDYDDVVQAALQSGAADIEPAIEDVEQQIKSGLARRPTGGSGGGGQTDAQIRQALIGQGMDPALVNALPSRNLRAAATAHLGRVAADQIRDANHGGGDGEGGELDAKQMQKFGSDFRPVFVSRGQLGALRRFLGGMSPDEMRAALADSNLGGLASTRIRDARQRIGQMINAYYHDVSGAAVSDGEAARYQQALGTGQVIDPNAFSRWLDRRINELDSDLSGIAATYGPEYRREWERRFREQRTGSRPAAAPQGGAQ